MPSSLSTIGDLNQADLDSDPTLTVRNGTLSVHSQTTDHRVSPSPPGPTTSAGNVTDVAMTSATAAAAGGTAGDQVTAPVDQATGAGGDFAWTWQMVVGVTGGSVVIAVIVVTAFIMFCYYRCHRRCCGTGPHDPFRFQNNSPQIWEDTVTLSYINAQFDLKDNSEEFASLENDTFLNSLESMMFHTNWSNKNNAAPGTTKL